jgi:hypothetical protein
MFDELVEKIKSREKFVIEWDDKKFVVNEGFVITNDLAYFHGKWIRAIMPK